MTNKNSMGYRNHIVIKQNNQIHQKHEENSRSKL